jgi:hypothetical protein
MQFIGLAAEFFGTFHNSSAKRNQLVVAAHIALRVQTACREWLRQFMPHCVGFLLKKSMTPAAAYECPTPKPSCI